jgi:hypothetical protein
MAGESTSKRPRTRKPVNQFSHLKNGLVESFIFEGQRIAFIRLLKNTHLLCFPHPSSLRRTSKYASLPRISGALHLGIFEQPAKNDFFSNLLLFHGNIPHGFDRSNNRQVEWPATIRNEQAEMGDLFPEISGSPQSLGQSRSARFQQHPVWLVSAWACFTALSAKLSNPFGTNVPWLSP